MCGMRESLVQARTQLINCVRGWMRTQGLRIKGRMPETFPARLRAELATTMPAHVASLLVAIDAINAEIAAADRALAKEAREDDVCRRLMTVPGVGPVTALRFVAALDERQRFTHAHEVASYLGLVPGEWSSSERKQRTSITKAGAPRVRWALVQAAWSARRHRVDDPMVRWTIEIERRRGKAIAIVALARKLAGILYAIWRDGTIYDASRGAAPTIA
jgi:transposase